MKRWTVGLVAMCGLLAGCTSWVPTVVNNGVNAGVNAGRVLSADRSVFNVLNDLRIKNEINSALLDEALLLNISADVYQGMVMLTGFAKDAETREKAEDLARRVAGVRELYNDIIVTEENWLKTVPRDLFIENLLTARMVLTPDVRSVNFQLRAVNGVVHVMGIAKSRAELDQVIALARASGARQIVSHVFLTEHIALDDQPQPTAEVNAVPAPVVAAPAIVTASDQPAAADLKPDEPKVKPDAKDAKKAKKKPVARTAPPPSPAQLPAP